MIWLITGGPVEVSDWDVVAKEGRARKEVVRGDLHTDRRAADQCWILILSEDERDNETQR